MICKTKTDIYLSQNQLAKTTSITHHSRTHFCSYSYESLIPKNTQGNSDMEIEKQNGNLTEFDNIFLIFETRIGLFIETFRLSRGTSSTTLTKDLSTTQWGGSMRHKKIHFFYFKNCWVNFYKYPYMLVKNYNTKKTTMLNIACKLQKQQ